MKITLVACNASYVHTNLAVRAIAQSVREKIPAAEVAIVERSLKDRAGEFLHALIAEHADIYGFSVYIWNRAVMIELAQKVKLLLPQAKILLGGPEISFEDESFFVRFPFVDNILAGEGEEIFADYVRAPAPVHTILRGAPYEGFASAGILYDSFPAGEHSGGILYYESSRGCPFSCSYCLSSATRGVRAKDARTVIEELDAFARTGNIQVLKFVDRTFNFDRRRADILWAHIARANYPFAVHCEICADLLDEENFRVLETVPAGKLQFEAGVQSTNPETLRAIGRVTDTEKLLSALARLKALGTIPIHADLIAGLPHEDFASFARSFDAVFPVCDELQLGFLKFLPGTKMRADAEKLGSRYSPVPPYEILQSDALTYQELYRLHAVDDILQRFNNEKWAYTVRFLLAREVSPFAFFCDLTDACGAVSVRSVSQREAFKLLRDFAVFRYPSHTREIEDWLALDWLVNEASSVPLGLSPARESESGGILTVTGTFGRARIDRRAHTVTFDSQQ